jgi:hypothetical protein
MTYLEGSPRSGPAASALLAATAVLTLIFLAIANYNGSGNGGTGPFLVCVATTLAAAAGLLYGQWERLSSRPAHWSLVLGIVAIVSCVVFWSGLPFAFGVTAIGLGARASGETRARIGLFLGGLAVFAAALGCIFG